MEVTLSIAGDYLTETARDWFYKEGKTYDKCIRFLANRFSAINQSKEQSIKLAEDILLLKARIENSRESGICQIKYGFDEYDLRAYMPESIDKSSWPKYLSGYMEYKKRNPKNENNFYSYMKEGKGN